MGKFQSAIIEYEAARQEVRALESQRADLINRCSKEVVIGPDSREICLRVALKDLHEISTPYDQFEFSEVLENGYHEGDYCKNCYDSYQLKTGPLAAARQRFGIAKRRISALGKAAIKSDRYKGRSKNERGF